MKWIIGLIVTFVSAHAFAEFSCESSPDNIGGPYQKLEYQRGEFTLEVLGFRVNYKAKYEIASLDPTRYGRRLTLTKTQDLSTWKNMPEELVMEVHSNLFWIRSFRNSDLVFNFEDCDGALGLHSFHQQVF